MKYQKFIAVDPEICHGKPVIQGTRIMVWQILELLEAKATPDEIYAAYPSLPKGSIEATLHFAAEKLKQTHYVSTNA